MAVMAYECGLSEDTLMQELQHLKGILDVDLDAEVSFVFSYKSHVCAMHVDDRYWCCCLVAVAALEWCLY
jgi:hypothetical protein